uniref:Fusion glycoprotein F0 n=1 Tax=Jingmen Crocidura shantungensis henipavirus 1 TaxID=2928971 RepID=A0AB38ZJP4_9MONO
MELIKSTILIYLLIHQQLNIITVSAGLDYEGLASIGVVKGPSYNYKIRGTPTTKLLVIKLIPNVGSLDNCTQKQMADYKALVKNVLTPVSDALSTMLNYIEQQSNGVRLIGAVLAGAALGVATGAAITAGIALHKSNQNAQAIAQLRDAIKNTNQAVQTLKLANQELLGVVDSLRGQINTQIIPVINQLSCDTIGLTLGIKLTQYYSEILTAFGPAIQDPVNSKLTIQAISGAFSGNFDEMMKVMGYTGSDLHDILQGDLITGNIIGVDPDIGYIALEIHFPTLTEIPNAVIQELMPISFNDKGDEWMTLVPRYVLLRTTYISNIDISKCLVTERSVICYNDYATPMSFDVIRCLTGNLTYCPREQIIASYVPRFALSGGVVYANCLSTVCRCAVDGVPIVQSLKATIMMLDNKNCRVYQIGELLISTGAYLGSVEFKNENIDLGPPIVIDKVDLGGQIAGINQTLQGVEDYIDKSNGILDQVNPSVTSLGAMIIVYIFIALAILIGLIALMIDIKLNSQIKILINQSIVNQMRAGLENPGYSRSLPSFSSVASKGSSQELVNTT